jgi:hypothetical protein
MPTFGRILSVLSTSLASIWMLVMRTAMTSMCATFVRRTTRKPANSRRHTNAGPSAHLSSRTSCHNSSAELMETVHAEPIVDPPGGPGQHNRTVDGRENE